MTIYNQMRIVEKIRRYLFMLHEQDPESYKYKDILEVYETSKNGVCQGISTIWTVYKNKGIEEEFLDMLKTVSEWDEKLSSIKKDPKARISYRNRSEVARKIERLINEARMVQGIYENDPFNFLNQFNIGITDRLNVLLEKSEKKYKDTFFIRKLMSLDEIKNNIKKYIKPDQPSFLVSAGHQVAVYLDGKTGKYSYYDPNLYSGPIEVGIDELVNIWKEHVKHEVETKGKIYNVNNKYITTIRTISNKAKIGLNIEQIYQEHNVVLQDAKNLNRNLFELMYAYTKKDQFEVFKNLFNKVVKEIDLTNKEFRDNLLNSISISIKAAINNNNFKVLDYIINPGVIVNKKGQKITGILNKGEYGRLIIKNLVKSGNINKFKHYVDYIQKQENFKMFDNEKSHYNIMKVLLNAACESSQPAMLKTVFNNYYNFDLIFNFRKNNTPEENFKNILEEIYHPLFISACASGDLKLVKVIDNQVKRFYKAFKERYKGEPNTDLLISTLVDDRLNSGKLYGQDILEKAAQSVCLTKKDSVNVIRHLNTNYVESEYFIWPEVEAASGGNIEIVKYIREQNEDYNFIKGDPRAFTGAKRALYNKYNEKNKQIFINACKSGNLEIVKYLQKDIKAKRFKLDRKTIYIAMLNAVKNNNLNILKHLNRDFRLTVYNNNFKNLFKASIEVDDPNVCLYLAQQLDEPPSDTIFNENVYFKLFREYNIPVLNHIMKKSESFRKYVIHQLPHQMNLAIKYYNKADKRVPDKEKNIVKYFGTILHNLKSEESKSFFSNLFHNKKYDEISFLIGVVNPGVLTSSLDIIQFNDLQSLCDHAIENKNIDMLKKLAYFMSGGIKKIQNNERTKIYGQEPNIELKTKLVKILLKVRKNIPSQKVAAKRGSGKKLVARRVIKRKAPPPIPTSLRRQKQKPVEERRKVPPPIPSTLRRRKQKPVEERREVPPPIPSTLRRRKLKTVEEKRKVPPPIPISLRRQKQKPIEGEREVPSKQTKHKKTLQKEPKQKFKLKVKTPKWYKKHFLPFFKDVQKRMKKISLPKVSLRKKKKRKQKRQKNKKGL